jgi:hypothetical protein
MNFGKRCGKVALHVGYARSGAPIGSRAPPRWQAGATQPAHRQRRRAVF